MRRTTLVPAALALALLMLTSSIVTAGGDVTVMQGAANTEQPSAENNTFNIFGRPNAEPCWGHFNNTDADNSNTGYGEKEGSGSSVLQIDWHCRMDPVLQDTFALKEGDNIEVHLALDISGDANCQNQCENLNVSLMRGSVEAVTQEFNAGEGDSIMIDWVIPVTPDLVPWNRTDDNPGIKITWAGQGQDSAWAGIIQGQPASFRLYYTHPCHSDTTPPQEANCNSDTEKPANHNSTVTFPILNQTEAEEILDTGSGNEEETPGFGAVVGLGGLAAAAWMRGGREDDE
tara:strand:- start:201 stop:1064 length:864 start_codon:yes stop_codon:yes gene_type:complete